jgi:hypothetical protein
MNEKFVRLDTLSIPLSHTRPSTAQAAFPCVNLATGRRGKTGKRGVPAKVDTVASIQTRKSLLLQRAT